MQFIEKILQDVEHKKFVMEASKIVEEVLEEIPQSYAYLGEYIPEA